LLLNNRDPTVKDLSPNLGSDQNNKVTALINADHVMTIFRNGAG